jgi:DNA-binding NarL/FixJ family response regulator
MPKKNHPGRLQEIRAASPKTRIIILTGFADPDSIALVAREGAKGFVLKSGPLEPLLEAIQHVARGEVLADPYASGHVASRILPACGRGRTVRRILCGLFSSEMEDQARRQRASTASMPRGCRSRRRRSRAT